MKILLIDPFYTKNYSFFSQYSTGILNIASYIRKYGYSDIEYLNFNKEYSINNNSDFIGHAVNKILNLKPDIIGISCFFINLPFVGELTKKIKKYKNITIIIGGVYATLNPEKTLNCTQADYVVKGEGEKTFLELIDYLKNKSPKLDNIAGIYYRKNGLICHTAERELFKNLEEIPLPAYDLLKTNSLPQATISASRGCSLNCSFCSVKYIWPRARRRSISNILSEIKYLKNQFGTKEIFFCDDCLNLNTIWFKKLIQGLSEINIAWHCFLRIDLLDKNIISKLKKSGCKTIFHGIESGSMKIRQFLGRNNLKKTGLTNRQIIKIIKSELAEGLFIQCSFLIGIPTENKSDVKKTLKMCLELKKLGVQMPGVFILYPFPELEITKKYHKKIIDISSFPEAKNNSFLSFSPEVIYPKYYKKYTEVLPKKEIFKPNFDLAVFFKLLQEYNSKSLQT